MERLGNYLKILFCIFFVFLALDFLCPSKSQEVEDTSVFDYVAGSPRGPEQWGAIRPDWSVCSNGTLQSPIDLLDKRVQIVTLLGRIRRRYRPANATLKNRGHDMMLTWHAGGAGFIEINRTQYELRQCHWHSPSEHTINSNRFDLELHLVHQSLAGQIVVLGVTYRITPMHPDPVLLLLRGDLEAIASNSTRRGGSNETVVGLFDPNKIKFGSQRYYKYIGSLTVPPCTQHVVWFVSKQVRNVTSEQVNLLRLAVNDGFESNARPLQQVQGRLLQLYAGYDDTNGPNF